MGQNYDGTRDVTVMCSILLQISQICGLSADYGHSSLYNTASQRNSKGARAPIGRKMLILHVMLACPNSHTRPQLKCCTTSSHTVQGSHAALCLHPALAYMRPPTPPHIAHSSAAHKQPSSLPLLQRSFSPSILSASFTTSGATFSSHSRCITPLTPEE